MGNNLKQEELQELYEAIVAVDNVKDCKEFLEDLLTKQELQALSGRIHAARLLIEGKTYAEVTKDTDISSATLARVSKCVKQGKGYHKVLAKTK